MKLGGHWWQLYADFLLPWIQDPNPKTTYKDGPYMFSITESPSITWITSKIFFELPTLWGFFSRNTLNKSEPMSVRDKTKILGLPINLFTLKQYHK